MNKRLLKPMMLLFSLLLVFGNILGIQPIVTHAAPLDNAVTVSAIDEDGNDVLPLTSVSFEPGADGFSVLEDAANKRDVKLEAEEHKEFGQMIKQIGDLKQDDSNYWSFNTQGKAAQDGASSYDVKNGDNLTFVYGENIEDITVNLTATNNDGAVIKKTAVDLKANSTAYDALYQAAKEKGVALNVSIDDAWFTAINNIGKTELGDTDYWSLSVNDEVAEVGAVQYKLKNGDHVKLVVGNFDAPTDDGTADDESDKDGTNDDESEDKNTNQDEETNQAKPDGTELEDKDESKTEAVSVKHHIDDLINYVDKNVGWEYGSEWWVWSLAHTDYAIPSSYLDSVKEKVEEADGEFRGLDLQRIIIAISLLDEDATDFAGYNLINSLVDKSKPLINDYVYSLLAIDSAEYKAPEGFREELIDLIISEEKNNGGWSFFGDDPSVDMTAMVLASLAPYQDMPDVKAATDRGVDYLSDAQESNGGYYEKMNGGDTSEAVSQVIVALSALDIDPTSKAFTKNDGNLIEHLQEFKRDDNGFTHVLDDEASNFMSTGQALLGYVAYDKFVAGTGSVYKQSAVENDNNGGSETEKPSKPNEKPESPESSTDKKPDTDHVVLPPKSNDDGTPGGDTGNELPNTATTMFNYLAIGLLLMAAGAIMLYVRKRKLVKM